jgi:3-hydroxyacyl-[acyl-carrier-protein] dehydratase
MPASTTDDDLQTLDIKKIAKILPHRYPFLLIDKILAVDVENGTIVAQKNVTINEPFFTGHWPDEPIMPGVLILEAIAQAGAVLAHLRAVEDKTAVLLYIKNAKFRYPVRPGDVLIIHGVQHHFSSKGGRLTGRAMVGDRLAVEVELGYAFVEHGKI